MLAAPVAVGDALLAVQNTPLDVSLVVANDSDADNDALTIVSASDPANGTLTLTDGNLVYQPDSLFIGQDAFSYTVADGNGGTDVGEVNLRVNAPVDIDAARTQLLSGVGDVLPSPTQPGRLLVYGPTSFSILDADGSDSNASLFAATTLGNGRVIATNDHQWLNIDRFADDASMTALFSNGIDWLTGQANGSALSKSSKILTFSSAVTTWLQDQGYTEAETISRSQIVSKLAEADVLVGFLGSGVTEEQATAVTQFVEDGGGLFIADYGVGYTWWWNRPLDQAGGNMVLRNSGIFFTEEFTYSSEPVEVQPATGQLTTEAIAGIIDGSVAATIDQTSVALATFARIRKYLPETDTVRADLSAAFVQHRLGQVIATPQTPVSDAASKALLSAEAAWLQTLSVDEIVAHPTAGAVFGEIPEDAPRTVDTVFSVDIDRTGFIATGAYAVPGEVVSIRVPAALIGKGYHFRINGHVDNISSRSSWVRLPFGVSNSFSIDDYVDSSGEIRIANAFGGTIYLDVGQQAAGVRPDIGPVDLTITGAVRAPTFVLGETTDLQWQTERLQPGAYAELISDGVAISVPSSWIRTLDNPTALMTWWNDVVQFMDWVGSVEDLRTGPERFNVDVQISVGYLHAGYPIQGPTWASEDLVDLESLNARGTWGYLHELGHEKQHNNVLGHGYNNAWTFDGDTEVTVNIFANAGLELKVPNSPTSGWGYSVHRDLVAARATATINDASKPTFEDKDPYPFYFQLADGPWGWQGYRYVLATYNEQYLNDRDALPQTNQQEKDQWYIRWSTETGYDMTQYMVDSWKLEVSPEAQAHVAALDLPSWMPPAEPLPVNQVPVWNTKDSGLGSLRAAIEYANVLPGTQDIVFDLPQSAAENGKFLVELQSALPVVSDSVSIDGTTQAGYSDSPLIEIDGSAVADRDANGIVVEAEQSQISGLAIGGFGGNGIVVANVQNVVIRDSYIGLDHAGVENANGRAGVRLNSADYNSIIDNVIGGNDFSGIFLSEDSDENLIQGNHVGTDVAGQNAIANQGGVYNNGSRNEILDNLISGNDWAGVVLRNGELGSDTVVQGNSIGVNVAGEALGNAGYGILSQAAGSQIGGDQAGQANIISGNLGVGVLLRGAVDNRIVGNLIGVSTLSRSVGNGGNGLRIIGSRSVSVLGNTISANATVGLFLGGVHSTNALIEGNLIGTDSQGRIDQGNGSIGMILNGTSGSVIRSNVISGNDRGGFFSVEGETGYQFFDNRVGTNRDGRYSLPNQNFSAYVLSSGNKIGGLGANERNYFSAGFTDAVIIIRSSDNEIANNDIGVTSALALSPARTGIFLSGEGENNFIRENRLVNLRNAIVDLSNNRYDANFFEGELI